MSYLSCDMSFKMSANGSQHQTNKKGRSLNRGPENNHKGIRGYLQYLSRDIDVKNGDPIYGYHKEIDPSRTSQNVTFVRDYGKGYKRCESLDELYDAYERRIEDVEVKRCLNGKNVTLKGKKALRGNSCVLRCIVIQAEGHEDNRFFYDSVRELGQKIGQENIIGYAIHRDETSVHCHVLVVPVKEHSLDQAKVLPKNGKEMQDFHIDMRMRMRKKYKDISLENKPDTPKNEDGMTVKLNQEQMKIFENTKAIATDFENFKDLEDILNDMWDEVKGDEKESKDSEFIRIAKEIKTGNNKSLYELIEAKFKNEQRVKLLNKEYTEDRVKGMLTRMRPYQDEDEDEYEMQ